MASNVGVIISVAPFFTAILSSVFLKTEDKMKARFFVGFVVAMIGIYLISFNGKDLELNPVGDLGLGASALCFVTWNYAVGVLGAIKTSVYIYIVPVITVVTSVIVLKEEITWIAAIGIGLTLIGLFLSESKLKFRKRGK